MIIDVNGLKYSYVVVCLLSRGQIYSSSFDCLVKTVQLEGFSALYKGFLPIWARMVSIVLLQA